MNDIERLQAIYGAAGRELRRSLLAVDPANYSDAKAAEARKKAHETVAALNVATERWATASVGKAYAKSARVAKTTLEILGRKAKKKTWASSVKRITDDLAVVLIRANRSIPGTAEKYLASVAMAARTLKTAQVHEYQFGDVSAQVDKMAADAVKTEISHKTLANQVRDYLYNLVQDDQFIEIGGRMYRMATYAELVGRTELANAATKATLDLCHEYDNDLVEWSDHGTICEDCKPYEGNVYSISGMDPDYPPLEAEPPLHPNCEHALLPTSHEAISVRGEGS